MELARIRVISRINIDNNMIEISATMNVLELKRYIIMAAVSLNVFFHLLITLLTGKNIVIFLAIKMNSFISTKLVEQIALTLLFPALIISGNSVTSLAKTLPSHIITLQMIIVTPHVPLLS